MATQTFRTYSKCIFDGKRAKPQQAGDNQEESMGGKHATRARSWCKRGDVNACAAQTNMQCWVHQDTLINGAQVESSLREAWEHEGDKDEMNIVLQGSEQHFWRGTEASWMGCYDFPEKPGQGTDRHTRALWGQAASAFNDLDATL